MEHKVTPDKVQRILHNLLSVLNQGDYELGDTLIAASELLGRIIVSSCETPVSAVQLAEVMENHIKSTLIAGYAAKGYNMSGML